MLAEESFMGPARPFVTYSGTESVHPQILGRRQGAQGAAATPSSLSAKHPAREITMPIDIVGREY
jgi:hypothetical protein